MAIPILVRTDGPTVEPITLDEAKAHLRVLDDDLRDPEIERLIVVARETAEAQFGRALITQTWEWIFSAFPLGPLALPLAPVQSVASVAYVDADGVTVTWPADQYIVDVHREPALVWPIADTVYPTTTLQANAITLRMIVGYGDEPDDVPATIRQAMLLRIAWLFEHAGDESQNELPPYPFDLRAHYRPRWAV